DGFLERSVCETFIVVCVALAAWCAVRWRAARASAMAEDDRLVAASRDRSSDLWAFAVGLSGGAAVVFKPNAGLYLPAILLWMWWYRPASIGTREAARIFVIA